MRCNRPLRLVLVLVVLILLIVLILAVLVILVLVVLVVLILLVIHDCILHIFLYCERAARLICPGIQDLSLALKSRLTSKPLTIAAVIPPAVDFNPPVKTPSSPSLSTASFTPLARQ